MRITLQTQVEQDYKTVFSRFEKDLFLALVPPGAKLDLKQFGGKKVGDLVELDITLFGLIRQYWLNKITESMANDAECFFVDEGIKLPFPLKSWRHKHRILNSAQGATIVDEISYATGNVILDWLIRPFLWAQFAYRKPIYRRFFAQTQAG